MPVFTKPFSNKGGIMNGQVEIVKKKDHLLVTVSGTFSPELSMESIDAMVTAAKKEDCKMILLDCRPMGGEIGVLERFESGRYGALTIPRTFKIALLARKDQVSPDKFFQTVARNRGVNLTVFTENDEALGWLMR
jgi:hypothetical protein